MSVPEPMLSTAIRAWPEGGEWVLEPEFDGFRLFVEVGGDRRVRAFSRHATNLTGSVGDLLETFRDVPAGTIFDGELVALTAGDGRPDQNFAAVCRAVLSSNSEAARLLHYVASDLLSRGGIDCGLRPGVIVADIWVRRSRPAAACGGSNVCRRPWRRTRR